MDLSRQSVVCSISAKTDVSVPGFVPPRYDKNKPCYELLVEIEIAETLDNPEDWFNAEEIPTVSLSGKKGITIASYLVVFMVIRGVIGVVLGKSEKLVNKAVDEFVLKSQSFIVP